MAELATLARPYGRAVFEVAEAAGELQQWSEALVAAASVSTLAKVKTMLSAPSLTAKQKSAALLKILGDNKATNFANFISGLADNNRLFLLPEIYELFAQMKAQREKAVNVQVSTAYPLDSTLESKLAEALTRSLKREVSLSSEVDASLLGGAVIRAGDTVIDGSVKGRLAKLAETMKA